MLRAVLAVAILATGCKKAQSAPAETERSSGVGSAATEADCGHALRAASTWLASRQLGDNDTGVGSELTDALDTYAQQWRVRGAFVPWCLGRTDVTTNCFIGEARRTAACEPLHTSLLAHRVYGPACAEILTALAPVVLARQDIGSSDRFTQERLTAIKHAETRYRGAIDAAGICSTLGGVRMRCLTGVDGDECRALYAALREPFAGK